MSRRRARPGLMTLLALALLTGCAEDRFWQVQAPLPGLDACLAAQHVRVLRVESVEIEWQHEVPAGAMCLGAAEATLFAAIFWPLLAITIPIGIGRALTDDDLPEYDHRPAAHDPAPAVARALCEALGAPAGDLGELPLPDDWEPPAPGAGLALVLRTTRLEMLHDDDTYPGTGPAGGERRLTVGVRAAVWDTATGTLLGCTDEAVAARRIAHHPKIYVYGPRTWSPPEHALFDELVADMVPTLVAQLHADLLGLPRPAEDTIVSTRVHDVPCPEEFEFR